MNSLATDPNSSASPLPVGMHNIYWFACFNALSFQMVLGNPMILYAKSLQASATVLGIIAGMMPLLVVFQIPAAKHVARIGYKKFVFAGWGIRVAFIFGIALVPLSGVFLNPTTRLALILMLLFGFNLSRGISSCAWLPWITSLLPEKARGRFLSREAGCVNLASFAAMLLAALTLGREPRSWQFALIFFFSAWMGATSLFFLKRIPEIESAESGPKSTGPVPWLEIARFPPFRKLLRLNLAWAVSQGGLTAFIVAFLKVEAGFDEGKILLLTSTYFLGGLSSLWFLGSRLDRLGSKPILLLSLSAWFVIMAGWLSVAGMLWSITLWFVISLQFVMGLCAALVNMAITRLAMMVIPPMGRNHFFALFSVVGNLTLGLAPICWGLIIDLFSRVQTSWHGFDWNRYSLFFCLIALSYLGVLALARRLEEPEAAKMEELIRELLQQPQRVWLRIWPRG